MYRPKFILRNEAAGDGGENGGGMPITPSKWGIPDGAEDFTPPVDINDDNGGGVAPPVDMGSATNTAAAPAPAAAAPAAAAPAPENQNPGIDLNALPPFIRDAIKEHQSGRFNQDEFVERYQGLGDVTKAPAEKVIRELFTRKYGVKSEENPDGVTPEELDAYIAAQKDKNLLEFTARELRPQLKQLMEQEKQAVYDRDYQTFAETQEKNLQELFAKTANYDNIYGVKVGKADIETFNQEIKGFLLPEKGEQLQPLYVTEKFAKLLSNDETLYQMLFAATRNSQIKDALNGAKESTKRNIEAKLGLTPNVGSGTPSANSSGTVTPSLWAMPEE